MPIKLNLLAEAQAAEELRRKDPVKRAILVGAVVVAGMLLWSALLYWEAVGARAEQSRYEAEWKDLEKRYTALDQDQKLTRDLNVKLTALERYSTNRFLWGTALNAVQQTISPPMTGTIQILRLNASQNYQVVEAIVPKKGAKKETGKNASSTERITLTVDARDYGNPVDQNFKKFINSILTVPYFKNILSPENILLKSVGQPVRDLVANKDYAQFTLECQFPPTTRENE